MMAENTFGQVFEDGFFAKPSAIDDIGIGSGLLGGGVGQLAAIGLDAEAALQAVTQGVPLQNKDQSSRA